VIAKLLNIIEEIKQKFLAKYPSTEARSRFRKNQKPSNTVDLVTSFNLMICCIDVIYNNVLAEKRTDLINQKFEGLPSNWMELDFRHKPHCILAYFCDMTEEAKAMKATTFRQIMSSFFQTSVGVKVQHAHSDWPGRGSQGQLRILE